jgi:hypothetical protein
LSSLPGYSPKSNFTSAGPGSIARVLPAVNDGVSVTDKEDLDVVSFAVRRP